MTTEPEDFRESKQLFSESIHSQFPGTHQQGVRAWGDRPFGLAVGVDHFHTRIRLKSRLSST